MNDEVLLMGNNKTPIFLTVLFVLFIMGGLPPTSISADEAVGRKEIKKERQEGNLISSCPIVSTKRHAEQMIEFPNKNNSSHCRG